MVEVQCLPKDSFSLILSSNETRFTIEYSPSIELKKGRKYELALINLETYYTFPNIDSSNNIFRYSMDRGKQWKQFKIPEGSYELNQINTEIARLMKNINDFDTVNNKSLINISANLATLRCIIQINNPNIIIDFSHDGSLYNLLGYERKQISENYNEGKSTVNILSINSILVKCSIIEGSYLDSLKEPIIYSFFPNSLPGEKIIERPKNLIYLPLIVPTIYSIGIELIDNNGKLLNLRGEIVTIRLHLKEA
jgi:hypothetical protein